MLPQAKEFMYLRILFMSDGKMEHVMDRWIGAMSAVMRALHWTTVVKMELRKKAKPSSYQLLYVPTVIYGHELCVVSKRMRAQIYLAEMNFLHRVAGLTLRDRVRSSDIHRCLCSFRLRWFGHVIRNFPGYLFFPRHVKLGGDPGGDPVLDNIQN